MAMLKTRVCSVVLAVLAISSPPARAQGAPAAGHQASTWEVEGYGGLSLGRIPASGSTTFPDAGAPITTSNPMFPGRQTPSWFFGDGASMLNDVLRERELPNRLSPLDSVIAAPGFSNGASTAFGFRVRRSIAKRMSAEFSLDFLTGSPVLSSAFLDSVESTRASFQTAMAALLASEPFTGIHTDAVSEVIQGAAHEIAATGAIVLPFGHLGTFAPYLTLGGGVLSEHGRMPSVELGGIYTGTLPGGITILEQDHAVLTYARDATVVAVMGAGLRREMSKRWGLRIDGRVLLGPNGTRAFIDATPSVKTSVPAGFIETGTYPNIQFSNNPSTGRVSSLGPPGVEGFAAFSGSGVQARVLVTFGVFARF
jgi:hypothetical protein